MAIAELSRNQEPPSRHPAPDAGSVGTDFGKRTGFFALWAQNDVPSSRHPELVSGSQGRNDGMTCHCERPKGASQSHYRQAKAASRIIRDVAGVTSRSTLGTAQPLRNDNQSFLRQSRKCGFTLAEVLITLGVIGVVAAVTLPTVINNLQSRIRAEQVRSAKYKFTLATDKMNSLGLIGPYDSTEAFVKELQKHLKLAKVCPPGKLEGCWPTKEVKIDNEGKMYEIKKAVTGKQFKMEENEKNDYSSSNVGIVTADGVPMIISYNKKCEPLDPVKQYAWTTEDNKPVSNATAGCVAAVMDINGSKKPNKLGEDVVLFNAKGLGEGCGMEIAGKCFSAPISSYTPLTRAECEARKNELGIKDCMYTGYGDNDYWGGAVAACGHVNKMATMEDIGTIATALYGTNVGAYQDISSLTFNTSEAGKLGLPNPGSGYFYVWSGRENSQYNACCRTFGSGSTNYNYGGYRDTPGFLAVCIMD